MADQQGPPAAHEAPAAATEPGPPPASGGSAASTESQPAASTSGLVYADVPNRAIAYIIDAIILFAINVVIGLIIGTILPSATINPGATDIGNLVQVNYAAVVITTIIGLAINGAYFILSWRQMGGSPGQRVLGMQVGNASDGATLTQEQAIKRWLYLGAPFGLASALNPIPLLGLLIGLAGLAYFIFLIVSTAQSPTKQGYHDKQANTIVVKAARSVG